MSKNFIYRTSLKYKNYKDNKYFIIHEFKIHQSLQQFY